jgi:hypothetical protein
MRAKHLFVAASRVRLAKGPALPWGLAGRRQAAVGGVLQHEKPPAGYGRLSAINHDFSNRYACRVHIP